MAAGESWNCSHTSACFRRRVPNIQTVAVPFNRTVAIPGTRQVTYNVAKMEPYETTQRVAVRGVQPQR